MIRRLVSPGVLQECFIPQVDVPKRVSGKWEQYRRKLVPGYVFLVTKDVDALSQQPHSVPAFTKLLGNDNSFIPLDSTEVLWVERFTRSGHRVIDMSAGKKVGDSIVVTSGPLVGHAGLITKIDRHKRLAYVSMTMFGRTTSVKMGLEIASAS